MSAKCIVVKRGESTTSTATAGETTNDATTTTATATTTAAPNNDGTCINGKEGCKCQGKLRDVVVFTIMF